MIKIVGLGAGDISQISFGALETIKSGLEIYLRTENHPIVKKLDIKYKSFDSYYDSKDTFEDVYYSIAKEIVKIGKHKDIVYAVPGHPRVAEMTVSFIEELSIKENVDVEIISSMSFLDAMYDFLGFDPVDGFKLVDAFEINRRDLDNRSHIIITQVCDRFISSTVKLKLMEYYQDEIQVTIVKAAGVKGLEEKIEIPLCELDGLENNFDNLTSVFVKKGSKRKYTDLEDLLYKIKEIDMRNSDIDISSQYKKIALDIKKISNELDYNIKNEDIDKIISSSSDMITLLIKIGLLGEKEGYFDIWEIIDFSKKNLN